MASAPIILIPAFDMPWGTQTLHSIERRYADAVRLAGGLPLVVSSPRPEDLESLLGVADGVLHGGTPYDAHPSHLGAEGHEPGQPPDPCQNNPARALIPHLLQHGVPFLGINQGMLETNAALGGSVFQAVHEVPGRGDHRAACDAPPDVRYRVSHPVEVMPGGLLERLLGCGAIGVDSAHGQGVDRLAPGLLVEARAPDGLIEAFSLAQAPAFNLCVQWHPEWRAESNPVSMRLFRAFGDACVLRRDSRETAPLVSRPRPFDVPALLSIARNWYRQRLGGAETDKAGRTLA